MKKTLLSIAVAVGLMAFNTGKVQAAFVSPHLLSVSVQVTILALNTNTSIATTNPAGVITQVYKSTPVVITTADILKMLEVEYATTFPAGARLAYFGTGGSGFRVTDANANILLDVSSNFSVSNSVVTGEDSSIAAIGKVTSNPATTNQVENFSLITSDGGFFYHDSQGNRFHVAGPQTTKINHIITATDSTYPSATITITGTGGGKAFSIKAGKQVEGVITRGVMVAVGKNLTS